ncbi:N66 matrix protein-like [Octopus vulgaris]|uniref:N66 matrix protein-like n=1 Tax=Octopus vulgaris TaxID=6645 RepID=A0AA36BVM7_OCTVU|nr:N66 matrix protein-like [Octopus vulgaris]
MILFAAIFILVTDVVLIQGQVRNFCPAPNGFFEDFNDPTCRRFLQCQNAVATVRRCRRNNNIFNPVLHRCSPGNQQTCNLFRGINNNNNANGNFGPWNPANGANGVIGGAGAGGVGVNPANPWNNNNGFAGRQWGRNPQWNNNGQQAPWGGVNNGAVPRGNWPGSTGPWNNNNNNNGFVGRPDFGIFTPGAFNFVRRQQNGGQQPEQVDVNGNRNRTAGVRLNDGREQTGTDSAPADPNAGNPATGGWNRGAFGNRWP